MVLAEMVVGTIGYMLIEKYSFIDGLYMTVITITTVGFSEVSPLSQSGRLFTILLILVNVGIFAYLLATLSNYVIQGEIFKNMHLNLIKSQIDKLENHVIICGYGRYGKEISAHFMDHQLPFVIIDSNQELIETIQKSEDKLLYLEGDATQDEILLEAGIERAQAVVSALPADSDNLFIVLSARQLNRKINIISRANDARSQKKLLKGGASHVVMPEQIGGFYMATLVSKPGTVEFFSYITNQYQSDIGFEEVTFEELPAACKHLSIRDLNLRKVTGANIIGYKKSSGQYVVNPAPEVSLTPGSSFIILGNNDQLTALHQFLDNYEQAEPTD
ncbi:MAG: potassium transporter TrkA [Saprospiraceae bacterium]|nr:MAG: potassium transporter TrkA [Saprospiraceae bacterium]